MTKIIITLLISLLTISCNQKSNFNYYKKDAYELEIYNNKVFKCTRTKFTYDSFENVKWKYIDAFEIFNEEGQCIKLITPQYHFLRKEPKKINGFKELRNLNGEILSINLNGYDTTIYKYDRFGRLIKELLTYNHQVDGSYWRNVSEYTYDNYGNKVTKCYYRTNQPISCYYSIYKYDKNHRIVERKDSADYKTNKELSKPFYYKYDNNDNLIEDGNHKYILNKSFQVVEKVPISEGEFGYKYILNDKGYKQSSQMKSYNTGSQLQLLEAEIIHYKYSSLSLLVEEKSIFRNKLENLLTYEYEYFD